MKAQSGKLHTKISASFLIGNRRRPVVGRGQICAADDATSCKTIRGRSASRNGRVPCLLRHLSMERSPLFARAAQSGGGKSFLSAARQHTETVEGDGSRNRAKP